VDRVSGPPWPTHAARTDRLSLDQVVAALARSPAIEAVALIGSTVGDLRPESDLDLLVVLGEDAPDLGVLLTRIGGRLADVVFVPSDALGRLQRSPPIDEDATKLAHWLATGRVAHDRTGRATAIAQALRDRSPQPTGPAPADLYAEAIDVRFLYQLLDLFFGYFRARGLTANGEKEALRYLRAHDRPYLALFRACLHEPDRARRVELYAELVARTVAPIGPLWPPASTAVTVREASPGRVEEALRFWDGLFGQ
jgi:predicted nucleotidyltransferase